jgi:hypothetical protein
VLGDAQARNRRLIHINAKAKAGTSRQCDKTAAPPSAITNSGLAILTVI